MSWWMQLDKTHGSRPRCVLLMDGDKTHVANLLTNLISLPNVRIKANDKWMPLGRPVQKPDGTWDTTPSNEVKLGETCGYLDDEDRAALTSWWLAVSGRANTPNWDIVCKTCINDRDSIILVEAKAHEGELKTTKDVSDAKEPNATSIYNAMAEANEEWCKLENGFSLSKDSHYQLSNRFAFAWKVASMGYPVVLVYLGFLKAEEMKAKTMLNHDQWHKCVLERSKGVIPENAWDRTFNVNGTPLTVLIRSAEVQFETSASQSDKEVNHHDILDSNS